MKLVKILKSIINITHFTIIIHRVYKVLISSNWGFKIKKHSRIDYEFEKCCSIFKLFFLSVLVLSALLANPSCINCGFGIWSINKINKYELYVYLHPVTLLNSMAHKPQ